jgi:TrbB protein
MKNIDVIRLFERSMLIKFGSSGMLQRVSTVRLDLGVSFTKSEKSINAQYHDSQTPFLIDQFGNDRLADNAYEHLQAAMQRYARGRRIAAFCKNAILWGAGPIGAFALILVLNMAITKSTGSIDAAMVANQAALLQPRPPAVPTAAPATPGPEALARAMADGVKAGKFSIEYSRGSKGVLYVFTDPTCPHCQALEPELNKLGRNFTIHLFPVSVIGGDVSKQRITKLLCAKPAARNAMWKSVVAGNDTQAPACTDGAAAVAANDQIFRAMRFAGTPTIIAANGERTPDSIPNDATSIALWMKSMQEKK